MRHRFETASKRFAIWRANGLPFQRRVVQQWSRWCMRSWMRGAASPAMVIDRPGSDPFAPHHSGRFTPSCGWCVAWIETLCALTHGVETGETPEDSGEDQGHTGHAPRSPLAQRGPAPRQGGPEPAEAAGNKVYYMLVQVITLSLTLTPTVMCH